MNNILLIESNRKNANLISKILNHRGYEVTHTRYGTTGIDFACTQPPHLIVIALALSDVSGIAIARYFKNHRLTGHIPIIAITSDTSKETKLLAMDFGCDLVVNMPIDTRTFSHQISSFLPALWA